MKTRKNRGLPPSSSLFFKKRSSHGQYDKLSDRFRYFSVYYAKLLSGDKYYMQVADCHQRRKRLPKLVYNGRYVYFDNMNDFYAKNSYRLLDRTDIPEEKTIEHLSRI